MLVITIIVIIILAVAVILTLSNNNPIENARRAVDANDEATLKEEATLLYADWYLRENSADPTGESAHEYIINRLQGNYGELKDRLTVSDSGVITIGKALNKVEGVVIPNGFEHVLGTKVETGLVIKNTTDGNEFVWVPVDVPSGKTFEEVFVRRAFDAYLNDLTSNIEPYTEAGYTTEKEEFDLMVASVKKYGGFYIARYEASKKTVNGVDVAQSISGQLPWGSISWGNNMTDITSGAVGAARTVYPLSTETKTGDVVSILPYGVQWDATINWLEKNYSDILNEEYSIEHGNFSGGIKNTGSTASYAYNNIYDLAGNVSEWTMEVSPNGYRIYRGGAYSTDNIGDRLISFRMDYPFSDSTPAVEYMGFRIALYIK